MKNFWITFTAALGVLTLGPSAATAGPILWTLNNVTFTDGGTASGSFSYDATSDLYSGANIAISATAGFPATTFSFVNASFGIQASQLFLNDSNAADLTDSHYLFLFFASSLTNAGGTVSLTVSPSDVKSVCKIANCTSSKAPTVAISGGTVSASPSSSATPEPSTLLMLPAGLLVVVGMKRRRAVPVGTTE